MAVECLSDPDSCQDLQAGEGKGCGGRERIYFGFCLTGISSKVGGVMCSVLRDQSLRHCTVRAWEGRKDQGCHHDPPSHEVPLPQAVFEYQSPGFVGREEENLSSLWGMFSAL